MPLSDPSLRESHDVRIEPDAPLACTVVVDTTNPRARRCRLVALLTLVAAGVWCDRAYRAYSEVGTLVLVRSGVAFMGELPALPPTTTQATTTSAPAPELTGMLNMLLSGPMRNRPAASTSDVGRSRTGDDAQREAAERAASILAWGEGVRLTWLVMMAAAGLVMVIAGLVGLVGGSERGANLQRFAGWCIIAATIGTFIGIGLLETKAGFPRNSPATTIQLTLLQSGYGWFLVFVHPALVGRARRV